MKSFKNFVGEDAGGAGGVAAVGAASGGSVPTTTTAGVKGTGDDSSTVPVSQKKQKQYTDMAPKKSPTVSLHARAARVKEVATEETDLPWKEDPKNPSHKAGEHKDKFGNPIKNVAKHLARKAAKEVEPQNEDLRTWFKQKWVRMDTKGNIKGDCARDEGEGKPKCLPLAKARAMDKDDRATAARRKRREDPVADRPGKGGKPINVQTNEEYLQEKNSPTNPSLWSKAKSLARQKFDVYPSAYANGWASKWYKSKGGGWKSTNEQIEESKGSDYALYHKSYTDAIDHALGHHGKSGLSVSDDDRFHHVGVMSKKPGIGNTTSLNIPATHTSGKKHMIHIQVFNKGGTHPYELNTYSSGMGRHVKEEVSLDEAHFVMAHSRQQKISSPLKDIDGKVKLFPSKEEATKHAQELTAKQSYSGPYYSYGGEHHLEEEYGMWKVKFPKQHAGKDVAAGSVYVKAQNTSHAHKVAAKRVGVDHKIFKSKVTKSSILPEETEQLQERGEDSRGYYRSTESGAGLTRKGAKAMGVKTAVTTPPSKLDPDSKAAKRRKSFCARMSGMKGPMKDEKGRPTRKAMSLRRWNCNEEAELDEVLNPSAPMKKWIDDFRSSKAPQFKGKSPEKRREMAIAAKLSAERDVKEESPRKITGSINVGETPVTPPTFMTKEETVKSQKEIVAANSKTDENPTGFVKKKKLFKDIRNPVDGR